MIEPRTNSDAANELFTRIPELDLSQEITESSFSYQIKKTLIQLMSTLIRCLSEINQLKREYH